MTKRLFVSIALMAFISNTYAYKQADVSRIAPPNGEVAMLRGYDSSNGSLTNVCLEPVKKSRVISEADNPPGNSWFEYVTSTESMMEEKAVDVAVEVKVNFGIGSAKASTDISHYEKRSGSISSGAMWAYYSDVEAPEFSNPAAKYQLTAEAKTKLKRAVKRGKPSLFREFCGDRVVIGLQSGRYAEGILTNRAESSESEREKQVKVAAAIHYMGSSGKAKVEVNGKKYGKKSLSSLKIDFRTSGDVEMQGATDIESFRNAFMQFQNEKRKDTRDLMYMYVIDYHDLVAETEFDFGLSRKQLRKVRTIMRGISTIERAYNTARIDARIRSQKGGASAFKVKYAGFDIPASSGGGKEGIIRTRDALKREMAYLRLKIKDAKGCLKPVTKAQPWSNQCQNLYEHFIKFKTLKNQTKLRSFLKNAYASKAVCGNGYPLSTPAGKRLCRKCDVAKEPKFLNANEGRCGYLVEAKPATGSKRLWLHDLIIRKNKSGGEAGVLTQVLTYPDRCKRKGKGCGKPRANQLCKKSGLGKATDFEIWGMGSNSALHSTRFLTEYGNGKRCKSNAGGFSVNRCRTFKYIDCKNNG